MSFKEGHNCRMIRYNFLNINPSDTIVLKFYMLLLYIFHQTISKNCFLADESRCQSCVCFQALKDKNHVFIENIIFKNEMKWKMMTGPWIWYQICNCNHNFEEILNFLFSEMSSNSWICPIAHLTLLKKSFTPSEINLM